MLKQIVIVAVLALTLTIGTSPLWAMNGGMNQPTTVVHHGGDHNGNHGDPHDGDHDGNHDGGHRGDHGSNHDGRHK